MRQINKIKNTPFGTASAFKLAVFTISGVTSSSERAPRSLIHTELVRKTADYNTVTYFQTHLLIFP